ncbi:MAG TPA: hypothetical protein GX534_08505 [Thermoanaerobacterales bacterium]|nr:hypothetical protein [Thermoanaerobacterales bacterium]
MRDEFLKSLGINQQEFEKKYKIDLQLFLDAVSLGLEDEEISDLLGYNIEKVTQVRKKLDDVSSSLGLNHDKNLTTSRDKNLNSH